MGFHRYFLGKDPLSLFPRFFNVARSAPRMLCRESSVALEADSWSEPGIWSVMVHSLGSSGAAWRDSKTMELLCFMGWDWIYTCIYNYISIYICVCIYISIYIYDHTHAYDIYIYNIHIYVYRERCINKCNHNIYIYIHIFRMNVWFKTAQNTVCTTLEQGWPWSCLCLFLWQGGAIFGIARQDELNLAGQSFLQERFLHIIPSHIWDGQQLPWMDLTDLLKGALRKIKTSNTNQAHHLLSHQTNNQPINTNQPTQTHQCSSHKI